MNHDSKNGLPNLQNKFKYKNINKLWSSDSFMSNVFVWNRQNIKQEWVGDVPSSNHRSLYCKSLIEFVHIYLHILYIRGHKITNSHCNNLNWTLTTMLLNARNGSTVTRLLPSCILNGSFGELLQCCILKINLNRKDGRKKRRLKP